MKSLTLINNHFCNDKFDPHQFIKNSIPNHRSLTSSIAVAVPDPKMVVCSTRFTSHGWHLQGEATLDNAKADFFLVFVRIRDEDNRVSAFIVSRKEENLLIDGDHVFFDDVFQSMFDRIDNI